MTSDPEYLPRIVTEPRMRFDLSQSELAALIHRLVPVDTWMSHRSAKVIQETFGGDADRARRVADQVTEQLIRIHDQGLCACTVHEEPDGERIRVHCNEHCPRVLKGDWDRCMGC
jgi:hypothetical protein